MASITPEEAQIISKLPRKTGRLSLASVLGWESFDEEDDFQRAILLDYLYDSFIFTIDKGFPWPAVSKLLTLADEMLQQSKDKQLLDCVKLFSSKVKALVNAVSEENLKTYTGFFFDTFFHHFKLYQCVFTAERERMQIKMDLPVSVPPVPCPFQDGKDIAVWEYQEKINEIDKREKAAKVEREALLKRMQEDHEAMKEETQHKVEETHMPLERQELLSIMQEVAASQLTAVSQGIRHNIKASMDDLSFMLEKTAIPRPKELARPTWLPPLEDKVAELERADRVTGLRTFTAAGPPPRYKLNSADKDKDRKKSARAPSKASKAKMSPGKKSK